MKGVRFNDWLKPTFTNHDILRPGDIVCTACQFSFFEASELLMRITGKEKPQRMRNYSHIVLNGVWHALTKGQKPQIRTLLLQSPELAVIAESGQKHLVFRAQPGWIQFEEQKLPMYPQQLEEHMHIIDSLYPHFSKEEIGSGHYAAWKIRQCGVEIFTMLEDNARDMRGSLMFDLALFLAQREEQNEPTTSRTDSPQAANPIMEGDRQQLQEQLPL